MGIRELFSLSRENVSVVPEEAKSPLSEEVINEESTDSSAPPTVTTEPTSPESDPVVTPPDTASQPKEKEAKTPKPLRFPHIRRKKDPKTDSTPAPSTATKQVNKKSKAFFAKGFLNAGSADKDALKSALFLRSLIVGPSTSNPNITTTFPKSLLEKVKSDLSKPDSANKIIAQLRALPLVDADATPGDGTTASIASQYTKPQGPIHAICLYHNEPQAERLHFSTLTEDPSDSTGSEPAPAVPTLPVSLPWFTIPDAPDFDFTRDKLVQVFNDMKYIDLLAPPDSDSDGSDLVNVIGVLPDHSNIHPPTDRISLLTYWWGYEVVLPPPSMKFLAKLKNVNSICGTVMKFLTALALVSGVVGEILPIVRYISQYIDWQFTEIQAQDQGKGVVCSATWVLPVSLAPRPWDFPDPVPAAPTQPSTGTPATGKDGSAPPTTTDPPAPSFPVPSNPPSQTPAKPAEPSQPGQPGSPSSPAPAPTKPTHPHQPGNHGGPVTIPNTPVTSG